MHETSGWKPSRRTLLATTGLALATSASGRDTAPLEWLVGYPAGGGSDLIARLLSVPMSHLMGRSVVVSNKPGAATALAAQQVAASKTPMLFCADFATLATNPTLYSKLPYAPEQDFAWVGMLARSPMVVVVPAALPVHDLQTLVDWLKASDNASFASAGVGSPHHLIGVQVAHMLGLQLNHISYRGASPAVIDVVGGQVPMALMDLGTAWPYIGSKKLKALAVTALSRVPQLPQVPTMDELGYRSYQAYAWQSVVASKVTSPEVLRQANTALNTSLGLPDIHQRMRDMGIEPLPTSPQQAKTYSHEERTRWAAVIQQHRIRIE